MIDWIKNLFGARVALDLNARHQEASKAIADVTALFDGMVDQFQGAASDLEQVAQEAFAIAQEHLRREQEALSEASVARARAAKIQEFFA